MIENIPAHIWTQGDLSEYQIFDVRTPAEWKRGCLPNVECVSLHDKHGLLNPNFLEEFQMRRKNDKKLAFICHSGHRSKIAANLIKDKLGIEGVNLRGGMLALKAKS